MVISSWNLQEMATATMLLLNSHIAIHKNHNSSLTVMIVLLELKRFTKSTEEVNPNNSWNILPILNIICSLTIPALYLYGLYLYWTIPFLVIYYSGNFKNVCIECSPLFCRILTYWHSSLAIGLNNSHG